MKTSLEAEIRSWLTRDENQMLTNELARLCPKSTGPNVEVLVQNRDAMIIHLLSQRLHELDKVKIQ